ncbi:MAG: hypothetical protein DI537_39180 [Stutzerimonas stutzeri]|nr:MAG: hypothetical protein DI537_39180 [Stutzerimonas stutzeri]
MIATIMLAMAVALTLMLAAMLRVVVMSIMQRNRRIPSAGFVTFSVLSDVIRGHAIVQPVAPRRIGQAIRGIGSTGPLEPAAAMSAGMDCSRRYAGVRIAAAVLSLSGG